MPWRRLWWLLPVTVLGIYAAVHFWVCDDAFISFRYARNLIDGRGLVFNPGERVEGYTNFLWTLEMALLSGVGIPPELASVILSALFTAGVLVLTAKLASTTPARAFSHWAALVSVWLLALNRNVAIWTTSGLETRQFTFLILLAVVLVRSTEHQVKRLAATSLVLGAAALTRPEGALLAGCFVVWYSLEGLFLRGNGRRLRLEMERLTALALPWIAIVGAHVLWRRCYYDEWLPNTFYAKVVRAWPDAGIRYFTAAALESGLYLTVPLALAGSLYRWKRRSDSLGLLSILLIVPHAAAFAAVGGDHFEFRLLDHYWPLLAVGVADGLVALRFGVRVALRGRGSGHTRIGSWAGATAALVIVLVYASALQVAQGALEVPHRQDQDFSQHIETRLDSQTLRALGWVPLMRSIAKAYQGQIDKLLPHALAVRWVEHHVFARKVKRLYGPYASSDRQLLPAGTIMSHAWLGVVGYALREVTVIDERGLTDKTVARSRRPPNAVRAMGHDREPPAGYLEKRCVNVKIKPACRTVGEALEQAPFAVRLAPWLWAPLWPLDLQWLSRTFRGRPLYRVDWESLTRSTLEGRRVQRFELLLDCETPSDRWKLEGFGCVEHSSLGSTEVTGQVGRKWLSSLGEGGQGGGTGRALSRTFVPRRGAFLLLKVGGGRSERLAARVLDPKGKVLASFGGTDSHHMTTAVYDLSAHTGQDLRVEIVDGDRGTWGHILVDHVVVVDTLAPEI